MNSIHAATVADVVNNYNMNGIIGEHIHLTQLYSGWCRRLNSHWAPVDEDGRNVCPTRDLGPHNTEHIFNCLLKPTQRTTEDFWLQFIKVVEFSKHGY